MSDLKLVPGAGDGAAHVDSLEPPMSADLKLVPGTGDGAGLIIRELVDEMERLDGDDRAIGWRKATLYVRAYRCLYDHADYAHKKGKGRTQLINTDIRGEFKRRKLAGPPMTFLSDALKVNSIWPDLFHSGWNKLRHVPYNGYRFIAACSLPRDRKDELRIWVERDNPPRPEVERRIREEVDARNGIFKPDFTLKVSNFWKFDKPHDNAGYGGVHPEVYANLLYWFTEPGDVVIDPMAGTGLLAHTLGTYRFFREQTQAEGSGPRLALMSDIAPTRGDIERADARDVLPFRRGIARLAVIDPPYLRIADGKYQNLGDDLERWLAGLAKIIANVKRCLRPDGLIAVMTDDVLRKAEHVPIAHHVTAMLVERGFIPRTTIYNHAPNFLWTMGPAQMIAARQAKLLCSGCKVIQVASVRPPPLLKPEPLAGAPRNHGAHRSVRTRTEQS